MLTRASIAAAAVASVSVAVAAQQGAYAHFRLERVADGVFAAVATDGYAASNAAVVDLGDSTLVFDTFMTPEAGRELRRAALAATGHEIRWVVDSHVHADHVGGNEVFADVPILATAATRADLPDQERRSIAEARRSAAGQMRDTAGALAREPDQGRRAELEFWRSYFDAQRIALPTIHVTPPDRTVDREQTLRGSRRSVRLIPIGAAHTKADLIAWVPDARVVIAGDLVFAHAHPYMPDGSIDGWLAALGRIKRLAPRAVIPGHGAVGPIGDVDAMSDYITTLRHIASRPAAQPVSMPPVPAKFAGWWFDRFFPGNLRFVAAAAPAGPAATVAATPQPAADLDLAISRELVRRGGVGAAVAVVQNGRIVLSKAYGRAALDPASPASEQTMFAVGSVTKQFTAAAILLLAEDGKLSVTDKVAKFYPTLTRASDITLLDLLNHVSGYRDYYPLDFVDRRMTRPIAPDALLAEYAGAPLDFEPGTRWSYSNTGFLMLGRIVEKVTSQPFGSLLAQRLFQRVGMRHTIFEPSPGDPRLARGYTSFALGPLAPAVPEATGWIGAAGGIWSTAGDLAAWDLALMDGRVLKPESWALMTTARKLAGGASTGYGCGLAVSTRRGGTTVLSHGGAISGFIASNTLVPATRSAVVVLINDEDGGLSAAIGRHAIAGVIPPAGRAQTNAVPPRPVPQISGPPPKEAAAALFAQLQKGRVDRALLGVEYSVFLTDSKIAAAARQLAPLGRPTKIEVRSTAERGGMETASVRLTFASAALDALMYRTPDGKIQEYLVTKP